MILDGESRALKQTDKNYFSQILFIRKSFSSKNVAVDRLRQLSTTQPVLFPVSNLMSPITSEPSVLLVVSNQFGNQPSKKRQRYNFLTPSEEIPCLLKYKCSSRDNKVLICAVGLHHLSAASRDKPFPNNKCRRRIEDFNNHSV